MAKASKKAGANKSNGKHVVAIYYISVGNLPSNEVADYMTALKSNIDLRDSFERVGMSYDGVFIPVREQPTRVEFSQF